MLAQKSVSSVCAMQTEIQFKFLLMWEQLCQLSLFTVWSHTLTTTAGPGPGQEESDNRDKTEHIMEEVIIVTKNTAMLQLQICVTD